MADQRTRFNPHRLALARRRRGLAKVDLAEKVGLTPRRVAAFENEGETPPRATLEALARVLDFPVDFFLRPSPPRPSVGDVSFRSLSRLAAAKRNAALAASALAVEVALFFDARFDLPAGDVPDLRDVDAPTAALALRSAWGLGEAPAPNMIHLLEAHGVRVFSLVDDCSELDGFSFWYDAVPFVFLTHHKSPERGRWDAAHELAHLVLHQDGQQGRTQEKEADEFAAQFLMPEQGVRASAPRFVALREVRTEKLYWRVSALAYIRRLFDLTLIPERRYKSLVIEASQAGYRRSEGDIEHETSKLVPKVLELLRADSVTLRDIAGELALPVEDLRGLLFSPLAVIEGAINPTASGGDRTRHLRAL